MPEIKPKIIDDNKALIIVTDRPVASEIENKISILTPPLLL